MKTMTPRQHKVAEQVAHLVAQALIQGRVHSTLPLHRLTVVGAWVSADLRLARIHLQLPPEMPEAETFATINQQLPAGVRKYLAENLGTKYTPAVSFFPSEE